MGLRYKAKMSCRCDGTVKSLCTANRFVKGLLVSAVYTYAYAPSIPAPMRLSYLTQCYL